jgi:hypothetical protein
MRVLLIVVSFLLAVAFWSFLLSLRTHFHDPLSSPMDLLHEFLGVSFMAVWLGWRGLILAVPAIVFFTDLRAWRFWTLLALGTALGPISFYVLVAVTSPGHFTFSGHSAFDQATLLVTIPVSSLSTLLYLLILRRWQRREQHKRGLREA